ncbi:MAG: CDP-4-dehydro-6-deoxyglucose reductase [Oceanicoccus sp.]|jgi:CDP-4-dehydro-6-deoxyglucose reductase
MNHQIIIQPKGLIFQAREDESILDAATRAGIKIRKSCTNGNCEICKATLLAGVVNTPEGKKNADHPDVNPLLCCVSKPHSDLILELDKVLGPGEIALQHIAFQVQSVTAFNDSVYKVDLLAPAGKPASYHAGQYLELLIDDAEYPFTIASAPDGRRVELHLGVSGDNQSSQTILHYLQTNPTVRARLPKGDVWLKTEADQFNLHDPLVFIVAGTGFAQAKAMIEEQLKHQHSAIHLYWINRDASGFYSDTPQQWADEGLIHYQAMTGETTSCPHFNEQTVETLIASKLGNLANIKAIACGGPNFVYKVLTGLEEKGFHQSQMLSDVFAYAPRPE